MFGILQISPFVIYKGKNIKSDWFADQLDERSVLGHARLHKGRMKGDNPDIGTAQTPKCFDGRLALLEKALKIFTDSIPNKHGISTIMLFEKLLLSCLASSSAKEFFVKHYSGLCIAADTQNKSLILSIRCDEKFTLTSKKTLMHVKTGQCAVPANNAQKNAAILLSSLCSSPFELTARFQLRHIGTERCTSPHLGHQWPIIGTGIVLYDICNDASSLKTQFVFMYGKKINSFQFHCLILCHTILLATTYLKYDLHLVFEDLEPGWCTCITFEVPDRSLGRNSQNKDQFWTEFCQNRISVFVISMINLTMKIS